MVPTRIRRKLLWLVACLFAGVVTAFANAWLCTIVYSKSARVTYNMVLAKPDAHWYVSFCLDSLLGHEFGWIGPLDLDPATGRPVQRYDLNGKLVTTSKGLHPPSRSDVESLIKLRFGEGAALDAWNAYRPEASLAGIFAAGWPIPLLYCATNYNPDGGYTQGDVYGGISGEWFGSMHRPFFHDYGLPCFPLPGFWIWVVFTGGSIFASYELFAFLRVRKRRRTVACLSCGYSLVGLYGPCPECGGSHELSK